MFARCRLTFFLLFLLPLTGRGAEPSPTPAAAVDEESPNDYAANLSTLGRRPDWADLER